MAPVDEKGTGIGLAARADTVAVEANADTDLGVDDGVFATFQTEGGECPVVASLFAKNALSSEVGLKDNAVFDAKYIFVPTVIRQRMAPTNVN